MVGLGALLSGLVAFLLTLQGVPNIPRTFILVDPIGFALRPRVDPLAVIAMVLALLVLVGLTWLFTRMIVRSALPGRASAVFFGTWGAVIVAAWAAGVLRAPLVLIVLRLPAEQSEMLQTQFVQISMAGVSWGVMWGWLTALAVALVHRFAAGGSPVTAAQTAPPAASYPPHQPFAQAFPHETHAAAADPAYPLGAPHQYPDAAQPPHPSAAEPPARG